MVALSVRDVPSSRCLGRLFVKFLLIALCVLFAVHTPICRSEPEDGALVTSWTYSYIKAKDGQRQALAEFIQRNWFEMDRRAVDQGLFRDYRLIENSNAGDDVKWDLIVAVEYYGNEEYRDIADAFKKIRDAHQVEEVNGKNFTDLGKVIRSEKARYVSPENNPMASCAGVDLDVVNPYLGYWLEYGGDPAKNEPVGILEIRPSLNGCGFIKFFDLFDSDDTYSTTVYYDKDKAIWRELFTFSNGGYTHVDWVAAGKEIRMNSVPPSVSAPKRHRNRWTQIKSEQFKIIEERSSDGGATWEKKSTTWMVRR